MGRYMSAEDILLLHFYTSKVLFTRIIKDIVLTVCPFSSSRYQLKSDELERQKKDLKAQYSTLEKEKKDIVEFLKRSLLEKEDEVDELTERLERQRQAAEKERDAMQLQQNQLRQELQGRTEELTVENITLGEAQTLLQHAATLD